MNTPKASRRSLDVIEVSPERHPQPAPVTTIRMVPLEDLVESPFNKRRTWGNLKELAASMGNGVGILEPLLARPVHARPGLGEKLELVFGHRRLRAAKLAKLTNVPVMVRVLADDVALEMQAIENLQRVDLHPLEIVRMGVSTFEREFLADLVLPNGETAHQTLGTYMAKLIAEGYTGPLALPERAS